MACLDLLLWAALIVAVVLLCCKCNSSFSNARFSGGSNAMSQLGKFYPASGEGFMAQSSHGMIPISRYCGPRGEGLAGSNAMAQMGHFYGHEGMTNPMNTLSALYSHE